MKISVVVPLNNRYELTQYTLSNLVRTSAIKNYEFIVVLDAVKDEREIELVKNLQKKGVIKKVIYKEKATCEVDVAKLGFEHASSDYYIYIASDLIFHNYFRKDWMHEQCLILKKHKEIGTVTMCRKSPVTASRGGWVRYGLKMLKNGEIVYVIGLATARQFAIRKRDWKSAIKSVQHCKNARWEVELGLALNKRRLLHAESNDLSIGYLHIGMKGGVLVNSRKMWRQIKDKMPQLVKAYEQGSFAPPVDGLESL